MITSLFCNLKNLTRTFIMADSSKGTLSLTDTGQTNEQRISCLIYDFFCFFRFQISVFYHSPNLPYSKRVGSPAAALPF